MIYSKLLCAPLLVTGLVFLAPSVALAQSDIRTERVQFAQGATSTIVEGVITGYETVDYVFRASEGQLLNISMATDNTANYFNILAPGEDEVAIFNGSVSENQYEGILPESGDYKVRVYMMRSAARRDEVANYRLEMVIGDNTSASDNSFNTGDALVAGTNYNATGDIPCAMAESQPTSFCPFSVTREGNGNGTVTVTKPNGRTRTIFFENGEAIGYDMSEADPGEFSAEKRDDLSIIYIGEERYEIPDAVIFGG